MKKTTLLLTLTTWVCKPMKTKHHSPAATARMARALAQLLARRACLWAALGCTALAFVPHPAQAAVTEAWTQRYNGPADSDDGASAVAVDGNGNVVVTGSSYNATNTDYYTAKYAGADGALLWEKRYNGPANSYDGASAVAVDSSGNVVVTGLSNHGAPNYDPDYYTAKYAAADGTLLWEERYNGPANSYDYASAVALDSSGNVVVTGSSYNGANPDYYYTAKYATANGVLLWEQRYNGRANNSDYAPAVAVDGTGNVLVTGSSDNGTNTDYYTAKYAAVDGTLLWEKRYNGPANSYDYASAVAVDSSGNVVVTGSSRSSSGIPDYYTAKYAAADGALVWEKRYNGLDCDCDYSIIGPAVAVDDSGNVAVTGMTPFGASYGGDYTAKYAAADGALLWEKRSGGQAVAVDGSGNVVVMGRSVGNGSDYYTAKYAAANGALLWEKHYNGPANGWDSARSLALGPNGMVAITGSSDGDFGSGFSSDYATVVYWENLPPVSIALVPAGIRLRFAGVPGRSCTIERAPAVTGPWTTINTQTAPASGLLEYLDAPPPTGSAFYRTVQP